MSAPNNDDAVRSVDALPLTPLERPQRPRWRPSQWIGWLAWAGLLGIALTDRYSDLSCETAAVGGPPGQAVIVCEREYVRTRSSTTGAMLADLLQKSGATTAATALATDLLATQARPEAFRVLGYIARDADRYDDAVAAFDAARTLHRSQGDYNGVALDDQALSSVLVQHNHYKDALLVLDECISNARRTGDTNNEIYCDLAADNILRRIGEHELAQKALDRARGLATTHDELEQIAFEQGNLYQRVETARDRSNHNRQAIVEFERARALNERTQTPGHALAIELNLAFSLAEVGRTAEATQHLAAARMLDLKHEQEPERMAIAARIAYRAGDLAKATQLNDRAYSMIPDDARDSDDDRVDIAVIQTRIALIQGDLAVAERWAKRGVEHAERVRKAQGAVELRPLVLGLLREPYELLFIVLARAGRNEDAVVMLGDLVGRTLRDAMTSPAMSVDLPSAAHRLDTLGAWLPTIETAAFAAPPDRGAVLDTLRTIDLVALVVADEALWRVVASHGTLRIDSLGRLSALEERLDRLVTQPNDRALGNELGALILPAELFRKTPVALQVLLDGPLAGLPVAALRHDGRPLIAMRPMVRLAALPETACIPATPPGHATVIADAKGDLPDARREAGVVASLLGTTSAVGSAATSDALFGAANDRVLHLAGHAGSNAGGGVLKLADRDVSAVEIAARKLAPATVVVFACSSARSNERDVEAAGSLATAFLAAGSHQVVATLRPIIDKTTLDLAAPFYRAGGAADPVRALAAIQAGLAETTNTDWPSFAVFGHDVCSPTRASH